MEYEGCGETIGHGEVCSKGWLCEPCRNKYESADEIERLREVIIKITHHIDDNQSWLFIKTFALAALKEGE